MKTAGAIIEYFSKSTQAMEKLKTFQKNSMLEKYQEQKEEAKKLYFKTQRHDGGLYYASNVKALAFLERISCLGIERCKQD